ncbi:MAG: Bifunctional [glutamate--ammonia ligase]-adenylyl-L-tyrosine, partial [Candidatus Hydrogenedentes bacterium]|nr:Bifunctional [glutamate--ammonia ligase]-adenylyl-L-tyrosine [Candidatus Hydrogenedentota bacterium]
MQSEFDRIPFQNAATAESCLASILEEHRPGLATILAKALAETADPDVALVRLARFLEVSHNRGGELDLMTDAPRYAHLQCTIFDQSHFLTDIVYRNPEYMLWLWSDAQLDSARTRDELFDELTRCVSVFDAFDARCQAMRRFKRREILRIATRDIVKYVPLRSLTEDLSNLADAALEVAVRCGEEALRPRFGEPMNSGADGNAKRTGFVILAMGKLGGRELNFSSDIDLIFLYGDEGDTTGGRSGAIANAVYFQKLGEHVIKAISEQTDEDRVFRVDMRLRPNGRFGPLAIGIDSAVVYYERNGQAWERQALIKARPAAGDLELGAEFIERTRPFVFPRYFDDDTLQDILNVKRQTEAQVTQRGETEIDVKLGRGGIRDIEFTVQILQLLNGGKYPELRTPATLDAIHVLGQGDRLSAFEATALASNYNFFRRIEHRLQIEGSQQRHVLPDDPARLDVLARRLGYAAAEPFMKAYRERTEETRRILNRFVDTE